MKQTLGFVMVSVLLIVALGCAPKVMLPPVIDLKEHEVIGIIEFSSSSKGELGPLATQKFIEMARKDQGIVRIVELGSEAEILKEIGIDRLDPTVFKALGEKYQLNTIITGELLVSDVRPDITIIPGGGFMHFGAEVDASLSAQMIETPTGASIWNRSAKATESVGSVSLFGGKDFTFDAEDPDKAYGKLIDALVKEITKDFRVTWKRR